MPAIGSKVMKKTKSSFTLIELLLVMAVMAILMGLASSLRIPAGVSEATSAISGGVRHARSMAVNKKETIVLKLETAENAIHVTDYHTDPLLRKHLSKKISFPGNVEITFAPYIVGDPVPAEVVIVFRGDGTRKGTSESYGKIVITDSGNSSNSKTIAVGTLGFVDVE